MPLSPHIGVRHVKRGSNNNILFVVAVAGLLDFGA